ncbi:glycoside hydrolase [Aureobasidium pullulans]|nr:glycoside hydrolase [Aureobasidium pullulans]THZ29979.1 glycoside hydrolase [Aureobasidium pullulans]
MKFFSAAAALLAAVPFTNAYWKGFNIAANNPDGSCKTQAQWASAFQKLSSLPGHFTSVRLYASSDCNTLALAVPAALSTGTQLLVGVWAEDAAHFKAEKDALESAIKRYGQDWIIAISVGSEDLYRKDTNPGALAQKIYDVRGMVRAMGVKKEVGHVDTWTAWVDGANTEVIKASDFIGLDAYPYFEGSSIENASNTFWSAINKVRSVVDKVSPGKWVWVTETGWPVNGPNYGNGVASVKNAQTFWKQVACAAFKQIHIFWYVHQDYQESPSFGVIDRNEKAIYDIQNC